MNDDMLQRSAPRRATGSRLTCVQCERMLLDALDDTLLPEERVQFDQHLAGCDSCSRAMADAQRGLAWLGMLHAAPPEPPADLMERILATTSGDPAVAIPLRPRNEAILSYAGAAGSPAHADLQTVFTLGSAEKGSWFKRLFASVAQPRFAMTAAMAFFSIALTMNLTGVSLRDVHASSFTPANLRHSFWTTNARVFRYYDNLRVVYELESRVREVQRDTDDAPAQRTPATQPVSQPTPQPAPDPRTKPAPAAPAGAGPRSSLPAPVAPRRSSRVVLAASLTGGTAAEFFAPGTLKSRSKGERA